MNIFKCTNGYLRGTRCKCVYLKQIFNPKTGVIEDGRCALREKDNYNLYPEHNSDGSIVYNNNTGSDPFPVGSIGIIYESLRPSDTGLTFSFRRHPEDSFMHPSYSIKELNLPLKSKDDADSIFEVFGNNNITAVSMDWIEQKIYKIPRVEKCQMSIFGTFDYELKINRPRCLKNTVLDMADAINFSVYNYSKFKKTFYLDEANNNIIYMYCKEWFVNPRTVKNITEILIGIKNGKFVNLKEALLNNDVDEETTTSFLRETGTVTKKSIYPKPINIQKYLLLYHGINSLNIRKEDKRILKACLLNYILNNPYLQATKTNKTYYETSERYWFAMMLADRAFKEGIMTPNLNPIPNWFINQWTAYGKDKKVFPLFGELYDWKTAPANAKEDYIDSLIFNIEPNDIYPKMKKIEDILELTDKQKNSKSYKIFCNILRAGRKWNITEIQTAWIKFHTAVKLKRPALFWNWLEEVIQDNWETANAKMFGIGNISEKKSFAFNLLTFCKFKDSFDTFDVKELPTQDWYGATGHRASNAYEHSQLFWLELSRTTATWNKKKSQLFKAVIETNLDFGLEEELIESLDSFILPGALSTEDLNAFSRFNPFTGENESFGHAGSSQDVDMDNISLEFGINNVDPDPFIQGSKEEQWDEE